MLRYIKVVNINSCFMNNVRNGFLAGIFIGIGCVANVASNNAILGSFLFSLALLSICILQLKLCTGAFGYITKKENLKDCLIMVLSNIIGVSFICYITSNFSSIDINTSIIVENKLCEAWSDAFVRGIGCGVLIYIAVECFKKYKHPLVIIMPVMGFIICGFDHCIANYGYMILNGTYWTNNMIFWVIGNAIGSLMISKITF